METLLATIFVALLGASTFGQAAEAGSCNIVKAENGNYTFATNPECYGDDFSGPLDEDAF